MTGSTWRPFSRVVCSLLLGGGAAITLVAAGDASAQTCVPPPTGMVAWWPGDGNAEDIVGSHDGTLEGGATFTTGKVGQGFSFDGVDDMMRAPATLLPAGRAPRTVSFWTTASGTVTSPDTMKTGFAYGSEGGGQGFLVFSAFYGNTLGFSGWGWDYDLGTSADLRDGRLHHVTVTYDGTRVVIYADGTARNSGSFLLNTGTTTATIGGRAYGAAYLRGTVDEVAVWNRVLSAAEIQAIYDAGSAGICKPGPVMAALTLTQPVTAGCLKTTGKVKLTAPAPVGGLTVALHSDNPKVVVPASLTFKAGVLARSFSILTSPVAVRETAVIEASALGQTLSATQTIKPMGPKAVTLLPNPVVGGNPVAGSVMLQCPAAPGDIVVTLGSSNTAVAAPTTATITVPVGTRTMPFEVTTTPVDRVRMPTISAAANGVKRGKTLTVNPVP